MVLYQYCTHEDCSWVSTWLGGTASEDPALDHLRDHPDHHVQSGVSDKHRDQYRAQRDGGNITRKAGGAA